MKNYYQVLDIKENASKSDIKKAYRLYAKKFHPDTQNSDPFFAEKFKEIKTAYDILSNDQKRAEYDRKLNSSKYNSNDNFNSQKEKKLRQKEKELNEIKSKIYSERKNLDKEKGEIKVQFEKLRKKENEIQALLKEIKEEKRKEIVKWEKEKEEQKQKNFRERQGKIYLKKGNVLVTGNFLKIGLKQYDINTICNITIKEISKKKHHIAGWIILLIGVATITFIIGIFLIILSLFLIFKRNKAVIIIEKMNDESAFLENINNGFEYIDSDKNLAYNILKSVEKAKQYNLNNYPDNSE